MVISVRDRSLGSNGEFFAPFRRDRNRFHTACIGIEGNTDDSESPGCGENAFLGLVGMFPELEKIFHTLVPKFLDEKFDLDFLFEL